MLFQLIRWPWALLGCLHATVARITGHEFSFKVTPKGRTGVLPLPATVVAPYLVLAAFSAAPTLLNLDAGAAHGYLTLTLINAALYLLAAVAIVAVHIHEHPSGIRRAALRSVAPNAFVTTACSTLLLAGLALQSGGGVAQSASAARVNPAPLRLGVTTLSLADNLTTPWRPRDLDEVDAFERTARADADIVQWFSDWHHGKVDVEQLRAVAARGSTPQITWEPWDGTRGARRQPDYTLASIIEGRHDRYIRSWARGLRRYGGAVLLRFAQEMNTTVSREANGAVYPWAEASNGNRPGQYARAWRHVHDIFTAEKATNVRWIWSPVAGVVVPSQYPGDRYVDIVALSGFNGGTALPWGGWRTFAETFDAPLQTLHRLAPDKPVQISEVGTAQVGGSKPLWIKEMFDYIQDHPSIRSVLWFELLKQTDWRVGTSPVARRSFANGVARVRRPMAVDVTR